MSDRTEQLLDEIVRLLLMNQRRGMESQSEAIAALTNAGFQTDRIAELLGTSAATVRNAQQRLKKRG